MRVPIITVGLLSEDGWPKVHEAYAVRKEDESPAEAVVRSIERRTKTLCYSGPVYSHGTASFDVYRVTLVRPKRLSGGGHSVVAEGVIYTPRFSGG